MKIRAVLFDVYGTLLKSRADGVHPDPVLRAEIARVHAESPHPFPEVDIREIHSALHPEMSATEIEELALRHERKVNPLSAMPGAREALEGLAAMGLKLGLVSNAQFYTVPVIEENLEASLGELGIGCDLCWFSYVVRRAKPDSWLFEAAREALVEMGVEAGEVLYVGNDVHNDIDPARTTGFRSVLFAGDADSLRLRGRSPDDCGADHVIRDLRELLRLVSPMPGSPP